MPVVPATWEAEVGELLKPGPQRRGCSEPRSHHCTPAWATEQDSISKKKKLFMFNIYNPKGAKLEEQKAEAIRKLPQPKSYPLLISQT